MAKKKLTPKQLYKKIRVAVADYMNSEGCGCCQAAQHDAHREVLAKLLRVPKYADGSGYNFSKLRRVDRTGDAK